MEHIQWIHISRLNRQNADKILQPYRNEVKNFYVKSPILVYGYNSDGNHHSTFELASISCGIFYVWNI